MKTFSMEEPPMYYEELLKSYGLDPNTFSLPSDYVKEVSSGIKQINIPTDNSKKTECESPAEVSSQSVLNPQSNERAMLPVDCMNCINYEVEEGEDENFDHCKLKKIRIDSPGEETLCSSFQRGQCKDCGFYDDGKCDHAAEGGDKSPEDECEFDMRVFM